MIYHGDCVWRLDMSPDMKSKKIEYEIYNTILEIKFRKHGYKT